jgi:hypothetical protein
MFRRSLRLCALLGVFAALALPTAGSSHPAGSRAVGPTTDILIAFDTTGSMAPSIAAAKHDAQTILSSVTQFTPNARFAVASFRDRFYPGGQYSLLSSFSSNSTVLVAAIAKLNAVNTTNAAKDTNAEAYNLLFHQSYSDPRIGWNPNARKVVVVIGDAEPHSAGAEGIPGCTDTTPDWNGYSTVHELAAMREAKRTLVMIRQSQTATTSLACYSSLASLAYEGGAARNGGSANIATPVLELVKQAYAPLSITPQLTYGARGKTDGLTVRVANPNSFPLAIDGLSVKLPRGVTFVRGSSTGNLPAAVVGDGKISWNVKAAVAPFHVLTGHVILRLTRTVSGTFAGQLMTHLASGEPFTTSSKAPLHVVSTARRITVTVSGSRGARSIAATLTAPLGRLASQSAGKGRIVVHPGSGRSITLRTSSTTVRSQGAPTRLTVGVAVSGSTGLPACRTGTAGKLEIVDFDAIRNAIRTADSVRVALPRECGGTSLYLDSAGGGRTAVKVGFH